MARAMAAGVLSLILCSLLWSVSAQTKISALGGPIQRSLLEPPTTTSKFLLTAVAKHPTQNTWFLGMNGGLVVFFAQGSEDLMTLRDEPTVTNTLIPSGRLQTLLRYENETFDVAGVRFDWVDIGQSGDYAPTKIILDTKGNGYVLESGYKSLYSADPFYTTLYDTVTCGSESNGQCQLPVFLEKGQVPRMSRIWRFEYNSVSIAGPNNYASLGWTMLWDGAFEASWEYGVVSTMEYEPKNDKLWVFPYMRAFILNVTTPFTVEASTTLRDDDGLVRYVSCVTRTSTQMVMTGGAGWVFYTPVDNTRLDSSQLRRVNHGGFTLGACGTHTYPSGTESVFVGNYRANLFELNAVTMESKRSLVVLFPTTTIVTDPFPIYTLQIAASRNYVALAGLKLQFAMVDISKEDGSLVQRPLVNTLTATNMQYFRVSTLSSAGIATFLSMGDTTTNYASIAQLIDNLCTSVVNSCSQCMTSFIGICGLCEATNECFPSESASSCSAGYIPNRFQNYTCPALVSLSPKGADYSNSSSIVTVTGSYLPPSYSYSCKYTDFGGNEVTVPALSPVVGSNVRCPVPAWAPNPTGQIYLNLQLTSPYSRPWSFDNSSAAAFTFYDCSSFSCDSCASSAHSDCVWCSTPTSLSCTAAVACTTPGSVPLASCPAILSVSPPSVPKGGFTGLNVSLSQLPSQTPFECGFSADGITFEYTTATPDFQTKSLLCDVPDLSTYISGQPTKALNISISYNNNLAVVAQSASHFSIHDCASVYNCDQCSTLTGCKYCGGASLGCAASNAACTAVALCPAFTAFSSHLQGSSEALTISGSNFDVYSGVSLSCKLSTGLSGITPVGGAFSCPVDISLGVNAATPVQIVNTTDQNQVFATGTFDIYDCSAPVCGACVLPTHTACKWCTSSLTCSTSSTCGGTLKTDPSTCDFYLSGSSPENAAFTLDLDVALVGAFTKPSAVFCEFSDGISTRQTLALVDDSLSSAICKAPQSTAFTSSTGTLQLVTFQVDNFTAASNSLPFAYHDCSLASDCSTCVSPAYGGCSWCGNQCTTRGHCGGETLLITSVVPAFFDRAGGDTLTISSGPFAPTGYTCSFTGDTVQKTLAIRTSLNELQCQTPAWPYQNPNITFDLLFNDAPAFSVQLETYSCSSTGPTCAQSCLAQPYCGWCIGAQACTGQSSCSGPWVTEQCTSDLSTYVINHGASPISLRPQTVDFRGRINSADLNTSFTCDYGASSVPAVLVSSQRIQCEVSLPETEVQFTVSYRPSTSVSLPLFPPRTFQGVNCGKYDSCLDCTQGSIYCGWCIEENRCVIDLECGNGTGLCRAEAGGLACPRITSVTPASGSISGNEEISITGQCFASQSLLSLQIGNQTAQFTRVDALHITATTPAASEAGAQPVSLKYLRPNAPAEAFTIDDPQFTYEEASIALQAAVGTVVPVVVIAAVVIIIVFFLRKRKGGLQIKLVEPDYLAVAFTSDREPKFKMNGDLTKLEAELKRPDFAWQLLLDPITGATEQDDMAKSFVFLSYLSNSAVGCINAVVRAEVLRCEFENTIFRGNSMASKMFKFYSRMVGIKYLFNCLAQFLAELAALSADENKESNDGSFLSIEMEVDPDKVEGDFDQDSNTMQLVLFCQKMFNRLNKSIPQIPLEFRQIFHEIDKVVMSKFGSVDASCKAIGGFFYLRFVCPSITAPHAYGLLPRSPNEPLQRQVVLISKVLQSLANLTAPGKKEAYMESVNEFIERNIPKMQTFYDQLRNPPGNATSASDITVPNVVRENALCAVWAQMVGNTKKINDAIAASDSANASELTQAFSAIQSSHPDKPSKIKAKAKK